MNLMLHEEEQNRTTTEQASSPDNRVFSVKDHINVGQAPDKDQIYFDTQLLEKVLYHQPFRAKYGKKTSKWEVICAELKQDTLIKRRTCVRYTRLRFNNLMKDFEQRVDQDKSLQRLINGKIPMKAKPGLNQVDILLARIFKLPKRLSKRSIQRQKMERRAQLIAANTEEHGHEHEQEQIDSDSQESTKSSSCVKLAVQTQVPVSITRETSSTSLVSDFDQGSPSDSSYSVFSDDLTLCPGVRDETSNSLVFNQTLKDICVQSDDDEESEFKCPFEDEMIGNTNLENYVGFRGDSQFELYSGFNDTFDLTLERQKMKWRWEYLKIMKRELSQRQYYRERKLNLLKEFAFANST